MLPALVPIYYSLLGHGLGEWSERRERDKSKMRTGSILCPGVDVDKYEEVCVAPLVRDAWNYWRVLFSTRTGSRPDNLQSKALAFVGYLSQHELEGRIPGNSVTVVVNDSTENPWGTPTQVTAMNACDFPILLTHSKFNPPYLTAHIRFIYRGVESGLPWPAIKQNAWGLITRNCPNDADIVLDTVYTPSQLNVPDAKDDSFLPPLVEQKVPSPSLGVKVAIGGAAVLGIAVLGGYAVRSFR